MIIRRSLCRDPTPRLCVGRLRCACVAANLSPRLRRKRASRRPPCSGGRSRPWSMRGCGLVCPAWSLMSWPGRASGSRSWKLSWRLRGMPVRCSTSTWCSPQKANRGRRRADRAKPFESVGLPDCWVDSVNFSCTPSAPGLYRRVRRLIVAEEIARIHQRSRGTYGKRRVRAALLAQHEMIVNLKLVTAIMRERDLADLPRHRKRPHSHLTCLSVCSVLWGFRMSRSSHRGCLSCPRDLAGTVPSPRGWSRK